MQLLHNMWTHSAIACLTIVTVEEELGQVLLVGTSSAQLVLAPTRYLAKNSSLIDHISVSHPEMFSVGTGDLGLPDHCLVYTANKKCEIKQPKVRSRSYRSYSRDHYCADVECIVWNDLFHINDLDEAVHFFKARLQEVVNLHAPYKWIEGRKKHPCNHAVN